MTDAETKLYIETIFFKIAHQLYPCTREAPWDAPEWVKGYHKGCADLVSAIYEAIGHEARFSTEQEMIEAHERIAATDKSEHNET